jgi:hypothetical protein
MGPPMQETQETRPDGTKITKLVPMAETCEDGDIAPLVPSTIAKTYGRSTLYSKMQDYLGRPSSQYGTLGPADFIPTQDQDFFDAYYKILPYYVFADPDTNGFVTPEGGQASGPIAQFDALSARRSS